MAKVYVQTFRCGVCGAESTEGWPECCATPDAPHAQADAEWHAPAPSKKKGGES